MFGLNCLWNYRSRRWVGNIVLVRLLISSCAGDTPRSEKGVFRYLSYPSNGSLLLCIRLFQNPLCCLNYSLCLHAPLDWGCLGELVWCLNPHSSANCLNCLNQIGFLCCRIEIWDPLFLMTWSGMPNLASVLTKYLDFKVLGINVGYK